MIATNVEFYSAVVLDLAEIPPDLTPAMFACARVAGWSAHILEEKRTGRLIRPSAQYVGPGAAPLRTCERRTGSELTLAEAVAQRPSWPTSARSPTCAARSTTSSRRRPASDDFRERALAYRAIGQLRFPQKTELLRRGLEDDEPGVPRLGAPLARAPVPRPPRPGQRAPAAAAQARERAIRTRRSAGSPPLPEERLAAQDTITLLAHIADEDEERELRSGRSGAPASKQKAATASRSRSRRRRRSRAA